MIKVKKVLELKEMPFDKDGRHATGRELQLEDGSWVTEYEGDEDYYITDENTEYCEEDK